MRNALHLVSVLGVIAALETACGPSLDDYQLFIGEATWPNLHYSVHMTPTGGGCQAAPPDTVGVFNGEEMTLETLGEDPDTLFGCDGFLAGPGLERGPRFRTGEVTPPAEAQDGVFELTSGGERYRYVATNLMAKRGLRRTEESVLHPGDKVELEYWPTTDTIRLAGAFADVVRAGGTYEEQVRVPIECRNNRCTLDLAPVNDFGRIPSGKVEARIQLGIDSISVPCEGPTPCTTAWFSPTSVVALDIEDQI